MRSVKTFKHIVRVAALVAATVIAGQAIADDLATNTNTGAVANGGKSPTFLVNPSEYIEQIETYHWNGGLGAAPGTITLRSVGTGQTSGPWRAVGLAGSNNRANVNWIVYPNITLPIGAYQIVDSDPTTWSQNATSHGIGFFTVRGTRNLPPAKPAPMTYQPCNRTTGAILALAAPACSGKAGTTFTVYVAGPGLAMRPGLATFMIGPFGKMHSANINLPAPTVSVSVPLTLATGNGLSPGSSYTGLVPPGLCAAKVPAAQFLAYDIYVNVNSPRPASIDYFRVIC